VDPALAPAAEAPAAAPKKPRTALKIIGSIAGVVVGVVVGYLVYSLVSGAFAGTSKQALIAANVEVAKTQFDLPYQVDEVTVLDDITAESDAIHYEYTLTGIDPAAVSDEVLESIVLPGLCSTKETKELLDKDVAMKYSYVVSETGDSYDLVFTKNDC